MLYKVLHINSQDITRMCVIIIIIIIIIIVIVIINIFV